MKEFWDARAGENPYYFVDSRLDYKDPDLERFWADGEEVVKLACEWLGVAIRDDDDIVDIGCGIGRITRALARRGRSVKAIDVSDKMLETARELNANLPNVDWILGDGVSLMPLEDSSVDVCFSHVVFQHIPDPEITLGYVREMARVLREDGWAAFGVSNLPSHERPSPRRRASVALRALIGRAPRGQTDPAWLGSPVDLERVRAVAEECGAAVERVIGEGKQFCLVLMRNRSIESS